MNASAYESGRAAFLQGCGPGDNPFPADSADWSDWDGGFWDAAADDYVDLM